MDYLQEEIITNIDDAEAASPTMVFEFAKKAKTRNKAQAKSRQRPVGIPTVTTADLRDDAKLLAWFKAATQRKHRILKNCEAELRFVFEAAERALSEGNNPPALFVDIINHNRRDYITQAQEDRAQHRLRRLRNPEREAERKRQRDDAEQPHSAPLAVGDIVREFFSKTGFQK
jgi:hypothetical protein